MSLERKLERLRLYVRKLMSACYSGLCVFEEQVVGSGSARLGDKVRGKSMAESLTAQSAEKKIDQGWNVAQPVVLGFFGKSLAQR